MKWVHPSHIPISVHSDCSSPRVSKEQEDHMEYVVLQLGVYVPQVVFKQVAAGDMQEHAIMLAFKYLINTLKEKYHQNWLESFQTYQDSFFFDVSTVLQKINFTY